MMIAETLYSGDAKSVEVEPPGETVHGVVNLWPGDSSSPVRGARSQVTDILQELFSRGRRGWLHQARMDLERLRLLGEDWDTYGGHPPTENALATARAVLNYVESVFGGVAMEATKPYFVGPLPNGGVTVEWRKGEDQLGIDVEPTGQLGYIVVEATPAGRRFHEKTIAAWPEITDLLARAITQR